MGLISTIRARVPRPQFGLAALFVAMALAAIPLSVWTSREHAYRKRVAAANLLSDRDAPFFCHIDFNASDGEPAFLGLTKDVPDRGDVITKIHMKGDDGAALSDAHVSAILSFPELTELELWNFGIAEMRFAELARLPLLEGLELNDSKFAAPGLRHLTAMRSLRELNLSGTSISDAALTQVAALKKLEVLWIANTNITDNGLRQVGTLRSLAALGLSATRITDAGVAHLAELTRLESLELESDAIGDDALQYLARLPQLAHIDLLDTRVTDDGLKTLRRFRALETLILNSCEISDVGLVHLADVPSLRLVNVFDTKFVTAAGVARLEQLRPDLDVNWRLE